MFRLKSNNITDFPFERFAECNSSQCEDLAKEFNITAFNSWMLPQILAHYGNWQIVYSNNKVDAKATAKANMTTPWHLGLWRVCTQLKRGSLVKSQNNPQFASYSSLVPIILAGVKRFQGVPYQMWDIDNSTKLISQDLLAAMFWVPQIGEVYDNKAYYGLGSEELLALREQGLTIKSGSRIGQTQNPTSTWRLTGMKGTILEDAPNLVSTMLAQIWVAHPSLRTEYMVLDPSNWDSMPDPLIAETVFIDSAKPTKVKLEKTHYDLPWGN
jgi:hypothetical protein